MTPPPAQPGRGGGGGRGPAAGPVLPTIGPEGGGSPLIAWDPVAQKERWRAAGGAAGFNQGGTLSTAGNILLESALSYLGVGIQPPTPSWGNMIQEGIPLYNVAWWVTVFPGVAIMLTVLSLNLVGEGMKHALDPRPDAAR